MSEQFTQDYPARTAATGHRETGNVAMLNWAIGWVALFFGFLAITPNGFLNWIGEMFEAFSVIIVGSVLAGGLIAWIWFICARKVVLDAQSLNNAHMKLERGRRIETSDAGMAALGGVKP